MNGELIIPPITDPSGRNWKQPHRRYIELDETHALMNEQTFKGLAEYSTYNPSLIYEGVMWKRNCGEYWRLMWYQKAPKGSFLKYIIDSRRILIQD